MAIYESPAVRRFIAFIAEVAEVAEVVEVVEVDGVHALADEMHAHRVTAVGGGRDRIVAVLSYAETPNFRYTDQERHEFYGRTGTL